MPRKLRLQGDRGQTVGRCGCNSHTSSGEVAHLGWDPVGGVMGSAIDSFIPAPKPPACGVFLTEPNRNPPRWCSLLAASIRRPGPPQPLAIRDCSFTAYLSGLDTCSPRSFCKNPACPFPIPRCSPLAKHTPSSGRTPHSVPPAVPRSLPARCPAPLCLATLGGTTAFAFLLLFAVL